jgi:hypothetical protein
LVFLVALRSEDVLPRTPLEASRGTVSSLAVLAPISRVWRSTIHGHALEPYERPAPAIMMVPPMLELFAESVISILIRMKAAMVVILITSLTG